MKRSRMLGFILTLTLLTGCRDQFILEQLGFMQTIAYDLADKNANNDLLKITINIPKANEKEHILLSTIARTSKEARIFFSAQNNRRIVTGQLRSALFGIALAKRGIWKHVDTLIRDPSIGSNVNIMLVDGDANDFMAKDYKQYPTIGSYIDSLIRNESINYDLPDSNLYSFSRDYLDDGIDTFAPILIQGKDSMALSGLGFFNKDKFAMRIDIKQIILFALNHGSINNGEAYIHVSEQDGQQQFAMLSSIASKRQIKVSHSERPVHNGSAIKVVINVDIAGSLLEYTGDLSLQKEDNQLVLEDKMKACIEQQSEAMIKDMQKHNTDPLGIGQQVRNSLSYAEWSKLDWSEAYPNIDIKVHADVHIKNIGKLQQ